MAAQHRGAVPVYGTNIVIGIYYGGRSYNVRLGKQNVGDGSNDPILGTSPAESRRPESPETARVSSELEDAERVFMRDRIPPAQRRRKSPRSPR